MLKFENLESSDSYIDTIDFLENSLKNQLSEISCDLRLNPKATKNIIITSGRIVKEYDSYINHVIKINPFAIKDIEKLKEMKHFWEEFKRKELKLYD